LEVFVKGCSEVVGGQPCVGVAVKDGLCAVHALGYRQHRYAGVDVRCGHCRRLISDGEWYRLVGEDVRHVRDCPEHRDTKREREAKTA
jgi:hypothetical protein